MNPLKLNRNQINYNKQLFYNQITKFLKKESEIEPLALVLSRHEQAKQKKYIYIYII